MRDGGVLRFRTKRENNGLMKINDLSMKEERKAKIAMDMQMIRGKMDECSCVRMRRRWM